MREIGWERRDLETHNDARNRHQMLLREQRKRHLDTEKRQPFRKLLLLIVQALAPEMWIEDRGKQLTMPL